MKAQLGTNVYHLFSWTYQQANIHSARPLPAISRADGRRSRARTPRSQPLRTTQENNPSPLTASWARDGSRVDVSNWDCLVFTFMRLKCLQERERGLSFPIASPRWKDLTLLVWQFLCAYRLLYLCFFHILLLRTSPLKGWRFVQLLTSLLPSNFWISGKLVLRTHLSVPVAPWLPLQPRLYIFQKQSTWQPRKQWATFVVPNMFSSFSRSSL